MHRTTPSNTLHVTDYICIPMLVANVFRRCHPPFIPHEYVVFDVVFVAIGGSNPPYLLRDIQVVVLNVLEEPVGDCERRILKGFRLISIPLWEVVPVHI